jgi:hypothetical protein
MNTKRGRPGIKPYIKQLIYAKALQNKDTPRLALAVELKNLIEEMGEIPPTEETMMKLISQARNHPISELDEPWSVGCLAKYDVPPEALPVVMKIYEGRLREEEQHFTIREALWIGRLYKVIDDPIFLERFASAYALRDKIDWILDSPVNTRGFDFILLNYDNPERRAEIITKLNQFPGYLNPFPSNTSEEEEGVKKKLKQKGYNIMTPGEEALTKHVDQLWLEELPKVLGELKKKWGQKGYVMTPDEEKFRNWVEQKWPIALKEFRQRRYSNERSHSQEV